MKKASFLCIAGICSLLGAGCASPSTAPQSSGAVQTVPAAPQIPTPAAQEQVQEPVQAKNRVAYGPFVQKSYESTLAQGKPVLLFFYASWCPYCQKQDPIIEKLYADEAERLGVDAFRVHYADSQTSAEEKAFAKAFGISSQHTFVLLGKDGKEIARSVGPMTAEQVRLFLSKAN